MKTWHPKTWSEQAREKSNHYVGRVNRGELTIAEAVERISNSYRHPLIRNRAAKRFGRLVREGKVCERNA